MKSKATPFNSSPFFPIRTTTATADATPNFAPLSCDPARVGVFSGRRGVVQRDARCVYTYTHPLPPTHRYSQGRRTDDCAASTCPSRVSFGPVSVALHSKRVSVPPLAVNSSQWYQSYAQGHRAGSPYPRHPPPQPIHHPLPSLPHFHVELNSTGLLGLSSISVPTGRAAAGVALS